MADRQLRPACALDTEQPRSAKAIPQSSYGFVRFLSINHLIAAVYFVGELTDPALVEDRLEPRLCIPGAR